MKIKTKKQIEEKIEQLQEKSIEQIPNISQKAIRKMEYYAAKIEALRWVLGMGGE